MSGPVSSDEKKWQRRNDANTLIDAESIQNDPARYKEALAGLKEMKEEKLTQANSTINVYKKLLSDKKNKKK